LGATNLVITFNAAATPAIVEQLLNAFRFRATSSTAQRQITFLLSDGLGGISNKITAKINVSS
jgi:hypothetical protein